MQTAATTTISISDITIDPAFQMRCSVNQEAVDDYADLIVDSKSNWPFSEPCVVYRVSGQLILTDGNHRLRAMKTVGRDTIEATIIDGTRTDALLAALGANQQHGLRRNNADKRRAVQCALGDELLREMSSRELASVIGVSHDFVNRLRSSLSSDDSSPPEKRNGADGKKRPATQADQSSQREKIVAAAIAEEDKSDRQIAKAVGCDHKTVSSVRRALAAPHPMLACLPQLADEYYDRLVEDVRRYGQRLPIVTDSQGVILDGRSRLKACQQLGIAPKIEVFHGDEADKIGLIRSLNLCRSNLDTSQQAMYIAKLGSKQSTLLGAQA